MNHSASIAHFKLTTGANQTLLTVNNANKKLADASTLNKKQTASAGIDLRKASVAATVCAPKAEDASSDPNQTKNVWWRQLLISESNQKCTKSASLARLR